MNWLEYLFEEIYKKNCIVHTLWGFFLFSFLQIACPWSNLEIATFWSNHQIFFPHFKEIAMFLKPPSIQNGLNWILIVAKDRNIWGHSCVCQLAGQESLLLPNIGKNHMIEVMLMSIILYSTHEWPRAKQRKKTLEIYCMRHFTEGSVISHIFLLSKEHFSEIPQIEITKYVVKRFIVSILGGFLVQSHV